MKEGLETKIMLIAMVRDNDRILMRKKPTGSQPYKETWYLLGCESIAKQEDVVTITNYLKETIGITLSAITLIEEDGEIKQDTDGMIKKFIYKDFDCTYQEGTPQVPQGAKCVEWIATNRLSEYDIVPPSMKLFKKLNIL